MSLNDKQISELFAQNKWRLVGDDEGVIVPKGIIVREMIDFPRDDVDAAMRFGVRWVDKGNYDSTISTKSIVSPKLDGRNIRSGTWYLIRQVIEVDQNLNLQLRQYLRLQTAGMKVEFASLRSTLEDDNTLLYSRSSYEIESPEQPAGSLYRAANSFNDDDATYDGNLVYAAGIYAVAKWNQRRTAFSATDELLYRNSSSKIDAPEVTSAGLYEARNSINEFGLYDSALVYSRGTGGGSAKHSSRRGTLQDDDRILYREQNAAIQAPDSSPGHIYDATNSLNDRGTYDATLQYSQGNAATVTWRSQRTAFGQSDRVLYRNATTKVEAPSISTPGLYAADNAINQFGLYDSTLVYSRGTGGGQALHSSRRSALDDAERIIYRESNNKVDTPAAPVGSIYEANNSLNENGTYNGTLQYSTGNAKTTEFKARQTARAESSQVLYQNNSSKVEAPADGAGFQYDASNRVNSFGLYDSQLVYNAGVEQKLYQKVRTLPNGEGYETVDLYRNTSSVPAAETNVARNVYAQEFSLNEFDLYDGRRTHLQRTSNQFGTIISNRTEQTDAYQYLYENRDSWVNVPAGQEGNARFQRNVEDGTYTGSLTLTQNKGTVTWWGGTGEYVFHYITTISKAQRHIYIYDKYTRTLSSAESHLQSAAEQVGAKIIGANDGHIMDISPIGGGRLRARRIELL